MVEHPYLNISTKEALTSLFLGAHFLQPSIGRKWAKMKCLSQLAQLLMKFSNKTSQSSCFKPFYESSNYQLLSQSTLFINSYQQNLSKNEVFQQVNVNTNKIYQLDFLKVIFLNRSSKWALTGSFRRPPCSWSAMINQQN